MFMDRFYNKTSELKSTLVQLGLSRIPFVVVMVVFHWPGFTSIRMRRTKLCTCLTRTLMCFFGPGGAAPTPILVDKPPGKDGNVWVLMRKRLVAFLVGVVIVSVDTSAVLEPGRTQTPVSSL